MQTFIDYEEQEVILTESDRSHIAHHPEIIALGLEEVIGETLASPDTVLYFRMAFNYYRMYVGTPYGDKYVRVVVRTQESGRFVSTAHITDRIVRGRVIWEK